MKPGVPPISHAAPAPKRALAAAKRIRGTGEMPDLLFERSAKADLTAARLGSSTPPTFLIFLMLAIWIPSACLAWSAALVMLLSAKTRRFSRPLSWAMAWTFPFVLAYQILAAFPVGILLLSGWAFWTTTRTRPFHEHDESGGDRRQRLRSRYHSWNDADSDHGRVL